MALAVLEKEKALVLKLADFLADNTTIKKKQIRDIVKVYSPELEEQLENSKDFGAQYRNKLKALMQDKPLLLERAISKSNNVSSRDFSLNRNEGK
jgi:hypothetical protein